MEKKTQPDGDVVVPFPARGSSGGYRSGRSRDRETPETRSTSSTRSAGTRPELIQCPTAPCDLSPSNRANAVCPPTASHALKTASLLMPRIYRTTVDYVNNETVDSRGKNGRMTTKRPIYPASAFWKRLEEAIGSQFESFNQNTLADYLRIQPSAVALWYRGPGLPKLKTAIKLARDGGVSVDWLLSGAKPKYLISKSPVIRELFEICEQLDPQGEALTVLLRQARNELLAQTELQRLEIERQQRIKRA